ncbi:MAG: hypothetical protein AAF602_16850 [Myxococcota bacterium]
MAKQTLADWMDVKRLGPADRQLALQRMLADFEADPRLAHAVPLLQRALALHTTALETQRTFEPAHRLRAMHRSDARALDLELGRLLGGLHAQLGGVVRALAEGSPARAGASRLTEAMFPRGLAAVVKARYVDQHHDVERLLTAVRDPDLAAHARSLGLDPILQEVARVNEAFGEAVSQRRTVSTWKDVRRTDAEAYRAYVRVILEVLSAYPDDDEPDLGRRNAVLEPLRAQEATRRR